MKERICPTCKTSYPARAKICSIDGTPLVEKIDDVYANKEIKHEGDKKEAISLMEDIESEKPDWKEAVEVDFSTETGEEVRPRKKVFKEGSTFVHILPSVLAFLLTFLFFKIVVTGFSHESFVYRLFLPRGEWYQRAVPQIIIFLLFWSLILLLSKTWKSMKERKNLKDKVILNIPQYIKYEGVNSVFKLLSESDSKNKKTKVFQRIHSLLEQLVSTSNVQRSHEFLRHQSEIDSDTASSGYTAVRIFIWAMPILGFIGTVIGISLAVGNFSGFLTGDIENIEVVKTELSHVSTGLSFAFDTTLLGLVASLFAMLLTSFVQNREEGILSNLEDLCLKIITNYKTEPYPVSSRQSNELSLETMQSFKAEMMDLTKTISNNIKAFSTTSLELSERFVELSTELKKESNNVKNLISNLQNSNEQFIKSLNSLSSSVEPLNDTLKNNIEVIKTLSSFNNVLNGIQKTQSSLIPLLNRLAGPLEFRLAPFQPDGDSINISTDHKSSKSKIKKTE